MSAQTQRTWASFGVQIRDLRLERRWTIRELAHRAGISPGMVYRVESGAPASTHTAEVLAAALSRRVELRLVDPRARRDTRSQLSIDPVHSAMGEREAGHLRAMSFSVGVDEPYQHYQFAGRADVVAWDLGRAALLHIENRTRFPDFQDMAGSYNAKRAYLGAALASRLGIRLWRSEVHVLAALWSSEVLHALRLRRESFRSLCPDSVDPLRSWWTGDPAHDGVSSSLVVFDPIASGRRRPFVGLDEAMTVRPRHRGYADIAGLLESAPANIGRWP